MNVWKVARDVPGKQRHPFERWREGTVEELCFMKVGKIG